MLHTIKRLNANALGLPKTTWSTGLSVTDENSEIPVNFVFQEVLGRRKITVEQIKTDTQQTQL